ncbi:YwqH-like family protein [Streptococcus oralis]|uniref:YwqH-like family protein n=1 Tax=Streptococcus oralis TaxID=1303 RepID=UPI0020012312
MNAHSASISSAQSRITTIDEQLERLRTAKKSVGEIQKKVHDIRYPINHRNIQPEWQGKQKDAFTKQWETFSSDYTSFQTEMDTFYDAICDEITRLENQKNEENGIIGWCQSQINNLGNFIEKLLH